MLGSYRLLILIKLILFELLGLSKCAARLCIRHTQPFKSVSKALLFDASVACDHQVPQAPVINPLIRTSSSSRRRSINTSRFSIVPRPNAFRITNSIGTSKREHRCSHRASSGSVVVRTSTVTSPTRPIRSGTSSRSNLFTTTTVARTCVSIKPRVSTRALNFSFVRTTWSRQQFSSFAL